MALAEPIPTPESPASSAPSSGSPNARVTPLRPAATENRAEPLERLKRMNLGGVKRLRADVRAGAVLANEARHRALERAFGISRDQANLLTVILILTALEQLQDQADNVVHGPGGPTRADGVLGAALFRELVYDLGGPDSRETPLFGSLVLLAVIGGMTGPAVRRSLTGLRTSSGRARLRFNQRYGRLIGRLR